MATNDELAKIFGEMAEILEITGANRFRVNAHARVARVLKDMTIDVASLVDDPKALTEIDGIGDASAKKIIEYVRTGKVKEHQQLLKEIPAGLLDVLKIPGLGPKTVKLLWEQADVTSITTLKKAIDSGDLEDLPRMGAKTIQNIKDSIAFVAKSSRRVRLGQALPVAEAIVELLRDVSGTKQVQYAGSLRRGLETIGDIDILATTTKPAELAEAFRTMEDVSKVLAAGETKSSIRLKTGMQVDLRIVDDAVFGAALAYFTGSKQHNVVMRERAIKKKLRLNEYGLFPDDGIDEPPQKRGIRPVAAKTEESIFKRLGLPWIPPEIREDRGEFNISKDSPPALIELADIKAELHTHTTDSDGHMTIDQLGEAAKTWGFHTVAVTDHSKSSAQANGLSEDRLRAQIDAVHEANERVKGITILAGSEVDILSDGRLDYDDDLLAELDIVIASPHVALRQPTEKCTARLLQAIRHPLVHILGHPTGRMINAREGLHPDINALVEAAAEYNTALELNANFYRLDLRDIHVKAAVDAGALVSINTDAHATDQFDQMRLGVLTARRGWLTANSCINTWTRQKLLKWLNAKK
ncbi:MAG: DNA polymerase/3'-5' exonuclease PolX [Phycisphaerales bacterium]|nr:MAG: DNA polymerase/3'-5' exonuclease PolX [Phycisphaerales bacterium]